MNPPVPVAVLEQTILASYGIVRHANCSIAPQVFSPQPRRCIIQFDWHHLVNEGAAHEAACNRRATCRRQCGNCNRFGHTQYMLQRFVLMAPRSVIYRYANFTQHLDYGRGQHHRAQLRDEQRCHLCQVHSHLFKRLQPLKPLQPIYLFDRH